MRSKHDRSRARPDRSLSGQAPATLVWLGPTDLLGRLPLQAIGRALPGLPPVRGVETVDIADLPARLFEQPTPDAVLSPLFWRDGDVMEAARQLHRLEFRGPYRIVSPPLPRPTMVEREVLALCPGLDVSVIPISRV